MRPERCLLNQAVGRVCRSVTGTSKRAEGERKRVKLQTWMSSWSVRQLSTVTVSSWHVMRNFPSNMREIGDLIVSAHTSTTLGSLH